MNKRWAVIENNIVSNIIIADDDFIANQSSDFIDLTGLNPEPEIGSIFYPNNNTFDIKPSVDLYIDPTIDYLTTGTDNNFIPYKLQDADFDVSMTDDQRWFDIGCRRYRAIWLRYALYQLIVNKMPDIGPIYMNGDNGVHDGFTISARDLQTMLDTLSTIKFVTPY